METLLVTHKNCMDGYGCVLAFAEAHDMKPSEVDVYYITYGDDTKELFKLAKDRDVIMADFSFKRKELLAFKAICKSLVVIDHHKSAQIELAGIPDTHFDMQESGATLLWRYLTTAQKTPIVLAYIKDRDIWNWKLENSKLINLALKNRITKPADLDNIDIHTIKGIVSKKDSAIHEHKLTQIEQISRREFLFLEIDGHLIPVLNNQTEISEVGNIIAQEYPAFVSYFITDKEIIFSFRSEKTNPLHLDVAKICGKFGGGGHKHAAGMGFPIEKFNWNAMFQDNVMKGNL